METTLEPLEVLAETQKIEREMGRTIKSVNGEYHDRIIDIDILLYDDLHINTPQLTIPHPLMEERDFVMIPLREILK
jgi:2-amino-4-hydroxy-6-hydroxymethyldihydropteridine diphosphokinase